MIKDVLGCSREDSPRLPFLLSLATSPLVQLQPDQGMCFPRRSLPASYDGAVDTVQHTGHDTRSVHLIYLTLQNILVQNILEGKDLGNWGEWE